MEGKYSPDMVCNDPFCNNKSTSPGAEIGSIYARYSREFPVLAKISALSDIRSVEYRIASILNHKPSVPTSFYLTQDKNL